MLLPIVLTFLLATGVAPAADAGGRAEYVGGTASQLSASQDGRIQTTDDALMVFHTKSATVKIPYSKVNLLEYGQKVDRRYAMAILISPVLLLSKRRRHYLTVGYSDEAGRQQAMVFRVDKRDVRAILVSLEARTGRKVQYQDEEARKAGKG